MSLTIILLQNNLKRYNMLLQNINIKPRKIITTLFNYPHIISLILNLCSFNFVNKIE